MKILQLIYESLGSPFGFGGAGIRAYEIYRRLRDRHDITLLCMKYPNAIDSEIKGLRHIFVGTESKSLTKSVFSYTTAASNFLRKYGDDFDVIIENFLPSTPFFSRFLTKTPTILQVQGVMESHSLKKYNPIYSVPMYLVERFYPKFYRNFIFVSDITLQKVLSGINHRVINSFLIPNGVDEELLMVQPWEGDYILFFSRIDIYTKGLDILLEAFEAVINKHPEIQLILAGNEFDSFQNLISRYPSLKRNVQYAGFITGDEKVKLLAGAKIFVLPSRHESAPISILEAAACGKPQIVSNIPELSFVEKEGLGLSFPSGSVEGLKEQLLMLLKDSELRTTMGRKGREYASNFLWDEIAKRFEEVLEALVLKSR